MLPNIYTVLPYYVLTFHQINYLNFIQLLLYKFLKIIIWSVNNILISYLPFHRMRYYYRISRWNKQSHSQINIPTHCVLFYCVKLKQSSNFPLKPTTTSSSIDWSTRRKPFLSETPLTWPQLDQVNYNVVSLTWLQISLFSLQVEPEEWVLWLVIKSLIEI